MQLLLVPSIPAHGFHAADGRQHHWQAVVGGDLTQRDDVGEQLVDSGADAGVLVGLIV